MGEDTAAQHALLVTQITDGKRSQKHWMFRCSQLKNAPFQQKQFPSRRFYRVLDRVHLHLCVLRNLQSGREASENRKGTQQIY